MSSTIPAAIDALIAVFGAALPGTPVHDGQPIQSNSSKTYVCVGYDPDTDAAVEFTQQMAAARGTAGHSRKEEYDVLCQLVVFSGTSRMLARRTAAFDLLAPIEAALRTNPSLSAALGSGGTAQIAGGSLQQVQSKSGAYVDIRFRINCKARI